MVTEESPNFTDFLQEHYDGKNPLLKEIITKLSCMIDVGLKHLSLSRTVPSLSGGEIQRLFLASYMIADMDSIIFVFDEPTTGLSFSDTEQLMKLLNELVDADNSIIVTEHDPYVLSNCDYII